MAEQAPGHGPVIVVGGGFGGLYTALALAARHQHPPILLIEPRERFLFLPLLYELLSGELRSWEIAPSYDRLLAGHGVGWLQDRVERIDLASRTLQTAAGRSLHWNRLVLATGSHPSGHRLARALGHSLVPPLPSLFTLALDDEVNLFLLLIVPGNLSAVRLQSNVAHGEIGRLDRGHAPDEILRATPRGIGAALDFGEGLRHGDGLERTGGPV